MNNLGRKLLTLASDLADAIKDKNWFAVNGVQNTLIEMSAETPDDEKKEELRRSL